MGFWDKGIDKLSEKIRMKAGPNTVEILEQNET